MEEKTYRIHIRQGEFELDVEGDRAFVEAYAEAFLAEEGDLEPSLELAPKSRQKPKVRAARENTRQAPIEVVPPEKQALKAFMKGKKVKSNKERYLLYMHFLHAQGAKQVGDRHIGACYLAEGLPMPPTGRQNFGALRKEGLVKAGDKRGFWALTPAGLEGSPSRVKSAPAPKAKTRKAAKRRSKARPSVRHASKAAKKVAPKASPPANRRAAPKKAPPRKTAAKNVPRGGPSETATPEGA